MSANPVNLVVRFVLELVVLYALFRWGWTTNQGVLRWLLAVGLPLIAAAAWGVFRVPNDGGAPVVQVPGLVRLALEFVYFSAGVAALWYSGAQNWAIGLAVVVLAHYALSYDRVARLIRLR